MSNMTLRRGLRRNRRPTKKGQIIVADAREGAVRAVETTRDWAAPKVEAARDWAGPKVEPAVSKVKGDVLPKVAGAVAAAAAASEPAREEAMHRGSAALAALRGEIEAPKPKKRRLRKLLLLTSLVGAAVAGWKAWMAKSSNQPEPWATPIGSASGGYGSGTGTSAGSTNGAASSSTSSGAAADTKTGPTLVTDDAAGASPDEALADSADETAKLEATPADMPGAATTEKVSPKQSKKVKDAARSDERNSGTDKADSERGSRNS